MTPLGVSMIGSAQSSASGPPRIRTGASSACLVATPTSACSRTENKMGVDDYPVPERRYDPGRDAYGVDHPASRTRFYLDKRNGKFMGVCAGIADYTGFDVTLVRICFLATMFMS